jgi:hypothetical protein
MSIEYYGDTYFYAIKNGTALSLAVFSASTELRVRDVRAASKWRTVRCRGQSSWILQ